MVVRRDEGIVESDVAKVAYPVAKAAFTPSARDLMFNWRPSERRWPPLLLWG